ncbi:MAG TPA: hypothetical protein VLM42_03330 [Bryobacteraceae bacterium]|nr:hypothetical protein [Bryobacteraceae bacterium]
MTPEITPTPAAAPPPVPALPPRPPGTLRRRLWIVLFALFAFEIGAFLVVFPWMDSWSLNHIPSFFAENQVAAQDVWDDPYFRSALSCLGALNVYIALRQIVQLIRRSKQAT